MTVRVPTCSAMRIHLRRPYFSRPSTKRACSWADQRPALRFRVTVSPGRGRRRVFEVWSTPAVAQARASSARGTKRRGFLSGVKNATREIYRIRAAPRRWSCCGSGSIAVGFWSDDRCLHPRRCARGGRQHLASAPDYPWLAPRLRVPRLSCCSMLWPSTQDCVLRVDERLVSTPT